MTPQTEMKLRAAIDYLDLHVEYVTELPDNVPGLLEPTSRHILVNVRRHRSDQVFTIAHEMGHYIMHFDRGPTRPTLPWFIDHPWQSTMMIESVRMAKEWVMPIFEPEWQADAWAFAYLCRIGATDDLQAILAMYPEKTWQCLHAATAVFHRNIKERCRALLERLANPFHSE